MLNLFPIQYLAPFAYLILRLCIGVLFLHLGKKHFIHRGELSAVLTLPFFPFGTFATWILCVSEILIGLSLVFGYLTQLSAFLVVLYALKLLMFYRRFQNPLLPNRMTLMLFIGIGLSLFITGAGPLAFDLPL